MFGTLLLLVLAVDVVGGGAKANAKPSPDAETLRKAGIDADGAALLAFLRRRTLPEAERPAIVQSIRRLGSQVGAEREEAAAALIRRGPAVGELLRAARTDADLEIARRAAHCLQRIHANDVPGGVPAAVVRLLAVRKPAGTIAAVLAFLPFADNDQVADEARTLLAQLAKTSAGAADPLLVAALADRAAVRRAAAGQALARAGVAAQRAAVGKLLADPDAEVRFRVAQALAYAGDPAAVGALIETLPELPLTLAWQAEDFLLHLAGTAPPPAVAMGNDSATRRKCRDGWQSWWKEHAGTVELTRMARPAKLRGFTLIVLLDLGRVLELGTDKRPRWEINNLSFPLDVQQLGDDHVLIAEYYGNRVTERDLKGHIVWQKEVVGPLVAQRLAGGNTFVATDVTLFEFDPNGKEVLKVDMPGPNKRIMKALKLPNGEIACLTSDSRVCRLDAAGKELYGFTVSLGKQLFGGRLDMLPNGRVLVPHNAEDKVIEYDGQGKVVWEVAVDQPVAATRLPNGNTLVTSMSPAIGAVEFDRAGNEVWHYTNATRVTRAIRR